jgi:hypothetical protein
VTSVVELKAHRMAIAACFVFRREISRKAVWDFFDRIGHFRKSDSVRVRSVHASAADMQRLHRHVGFVPTSEVAFSFDHLIGAGEQRRRHAEAERLRGLQVDSQFEFCRLLDRDVARLRPAQNLVDKFGGASVQVHEVWSIGN